MLHADKIAIKEIAERIEPVYSDRFVRRFVLGNMREGLTSAQVAPALRLAVRIHRKKPGYLRTVPHVPMPARISVLGLGTTAPTQLGPWRESVRVALGNKRWADAAMAHPEKMARWSGVSREAAEKYARLTLPEIAKHAYEYWYYRATLGRTRAVDPHMRRQWIAAGGELPT